MKIRNSVCSKMAGSGPAITRLVLTGIGMAALSITGRYVANQLPNIVKTLMQTLENNTFQNSEYYRGFSKDMNATEAARILGIPTNASKLEIKKAYKTLMSQNHPDKGGSPYIAAKINEARDFLESNLE